MPNVLIDARALQPPEPLMRALAALDQLDHDDELTLILKRRPHPLFPILSSSGFRWSETTQVEGGGFKYRISKRRR